MNEVAFNKVIKKMILPKYPWITDYEVVVDRDDSINDYPDKGEYYRVNYFVEENQYDSLYFEKDYEKIREVRNLTKTLFMALGFDKDQKLEGVEFYNINHK
jgi:hypothetical protein